METFPKTLGYALGVLPVILGLWGGLITLMHDLDRRGDVERARHEARSGVGARATLAIIFVTSVAGSAGRMQRREPLAAPLL